MSAFLDAVQARLEAATPGPWKPYRTGKWEHDNYVVREDLAGVAMQYALVWQPGDAELIAHAPSDLAALLAVVRALVEARGDLNHHHSHMVPGRWDKDGSPCEVCARVGRLDAALNRLEES